MGFKRSSRQRFGGIRLSLVQFIGQAHLLPGCSLVEVRRILSDELGGSSDFSSPRVPIKDLKRVKEKIEELST